MLEYNTLVYLPKEDCSFFKVMVFRPDKKGYLVESCDPELSFGTFYRTVLLSNIPEQMLCTKQEMYKYWDEKEVLLKRELAELQEKQFLPDAQLNAKLSDLETEIQKNLSKITADLDIKEKERLEKVIRSLQKGARRTANKQDVKYKKFSEEIERSIKRTEAKLLKIEKDRKKLEELILI